VLLRSGKFLYHHLLSRLAAASRSKHN
jgi:hypothetical protein